MQISHFNLLAHYMPQYQGQHVGVGHFLPDTDDSKQAFRAVHLSLCSMDPV